MEDAAGDLVDRPTTGSTLTRTESAGADRGSGLDGDDGGEPDTRGLSVSPSLLVVVGGYYDPVKAASKETSRYYRRLSRQEFRPTVMPSEDVCSAANGRLAVTPPTLPGNDAPSMTRVPACSAGDYGRFRCASRPSILRDSLASM